MHTILPNFPYYCMKLRGGGGFLGSASETSHTVHSIIPVVRGHCVNRGHRSVGLLEGVVLFTNLMLTISSKVSVNLMNGYTHTPVADPAAG